jgi:hypothetical protein
VIHSWPGGGTYWRSSLLIGQFAGGSSLGGQTLYALADLTVTSRDVPHDAVVDDIVAALAAHLQTGNTDART